VLVLVELMAWTAIPGVWLPPQGLALQAMPFPGSVDSRALMFDDGPLIFIGAAAISGTIAVAGMRAEAVARRE
jgi:hypothetical protein